MSIPYKKTCMAAAIALTLGANVAIAQDGVVAQDAAATPAPATVQPEVSPAAEAITEQATPAAVETPVAEAATEVEQGDSLVIEEVVVTAQKREQNLQDTPIAIAAFDKQAIDDQQVKDISDLTSSVPNVQIAQSPGGSTGATISIRGSGQINPAITWEPAVGIYVDGVFVAKNMGGLFDVAELERLEVLRGPQGTLYGKNTTGGAVNIITRRPGEDFSGSVKAGVGDYGYTEFGLSVDSGRIGDVAAFNIAYSKRDRDGFYDNVDNGISPTQPQIDEFKKLDSEAGRVAADFNVSEAVDIQYSYDWSEKDNTPALGQLEPGKVIVYPTDYETADIDRADEGSIDGAVYEQVETTGHTLNVSWDAAENLTFKSITGKRTMDFYDANDYDGTQFIGFHTERHLKFDQLSQEFQLIGAADMVNYVAGIFYFNEDADADNPFVIGDGFGGALPTVQNRYGVEATSYAAFAQADIAFNELFTLTVGARYTKEEKEAYAEHVGSAVLGATDYSAEADDTWTNFSPMIVATFNLNENMTTYARVSQGWKAGGFNGEAVSQVQAETPYDEETLTSYEVGFKSQLAANRIQLNAAIFHNDINDMQVSNYLGAYSIVENAGEATSTGLELEAIFLITDGLAAFVNYGYLDTDYDEYIVGGVDIADDAVAPYSPENKFALGLEYVYDFSFAQLRARLDYSYTDEMYFYREEPKSTLTAAESYSLVNARIALTEVVVAGDNTMEVGVWGKNLTDEEYRINGIPGQDAAFNFVSGINYYGDPRTVGADVTYRF